MNHIYIDSVSDPAFHWEDDGIISINATSQVDPLGDELTSDTLEVVLWYREKEEYMFIRPADKAGTSFVYSGFRTLDSKILGKSSIASGDILTELYAGRKIYWYIDNILQGQYLVRTVERIGKEKYKIYCVTSIWFLGKLVDVGGLYRSTPLKIVLNDILQVCEGKGAKYPNKKLKSVTISSDAHAYLPRYSYTVSSETNFPFYPHSNGYNQNLSSYVLDVTIPETLESESGMFCFYGSMGSSAGESVNLFLFDDEHRTANQIAYGTNLAFDIAGAHEWTGDVNIPYLIPGTRHTLGIVTVKFTSEKSSPEYALYVDGKMYFGCFGNSQYGGSSEYLLYGKYNGTNISGFKGITIHKIYITAIDKNYITGLPPYKISPIVFYECSLTIDEDHNVGISGVEACMPIPEIRNGSYSTSGSFYNVPLTYEEYPQIIEYEIDDDYANVLVSGYLPYTTKRENLHKLLFATNGSIRRNQDGTYIFGFAKAGQIEVVNADRIYINGTFKQPDGASKIIVEEHAYDIDLTVPNTQEYFRTVVETSKNLILNAVPVLPYKSNDNYEDENIVVVNELWDSYEVVSGHGSMLVAVGNDIIRNAVYEIPGSVEEKQVSVSGNTLINNLNSNAIISRLVQIYTKSYVIKEKIRYQLTAGKLYSIKNPYSENVTAYLKRKVDNVTSFIASDCEFITDYIPSGAGGVFTRFSVLTGSGTYTIPDDAKQIRIVAIAGGGGGEDGTDGGDGDIGREYGEPIDRKGDGKPGKGGKGGRGGFSGNVLVVDIVDASGDISYSCGAGGSHWANGGTRAYGQDTTFTYNDTLYNTLNGERTEYPNMINNDIYARNGLDGYDGGDGGESNDGEILNLKVTASSYGNRSENGWAGGSYGYEADLVNGGYVLATFGGGNGGGGANGNAGQRGKDAVEIVGLEESPVYSGNGGNGGNAIHLIAQYSYGSGGHGGHGGGGGGAGGTLIKKENYTGQQLFYAGLGGQGGSGCAGYDGTDGAIIIFY